MSTSNPIALNIADARATIWPTGGTGLDADGITIRRVGGIPLIEARDDLSVVIGNALAGCDIVPQAGDVVVVAQKIVSKSEGRTIRLADVRPTSQAEHIAHESGKEAELVELILGESRNVVRVKPGVIIVRNRLGVVLANAGIDASNVKAGHVLLWPVDPDASARRLRAGLMARFGVDLTVIVSDSVGRAWRRGTIGTAIGIAGRHPLWDRRGEPDLFGRHLQATEIGIADEVAAAASLAMGEAAEGTPVVLVRGVRWPVSDGAGMAEILRPAAEDLFP